MAGVFPPRDCPESLDVRAGAIYVISAEFDKAFGNVLLSFVSVSWVQGESASPIGTSNQSRQATARRPTDFDRRLKAKRAIAAPKSKGLDGNSESNVLLTY